MSLTSQGSRGSLGAVAINLSWLVPHRTGVPFGIFQPLALARATCLRLYVNGCLNCSLSVYTQHESCLLWQHSVSEGFHVALQSREMFFNADLSLQSLPFRHLEPSDDIASLSVGLRSPQRSCCVQQHHFGLLELLELLLFPRSLSCGCWWALGVLRAPR